MEAGIDHAGGYTVFDGLAQVTEAEQRAFTVRASALLGELLPQDAGGALLRDVTYRGVRLGEGPTGRYSDSRDGGNLHTDGPHVPGEPPDLFTLFCVRQAPVGGDLVLVHRDRLLDRLGDDAIRTLRQPVHFDRRVQGGGTVSRPVLADGRISYLRQYIELGHAHPGVPDLTAAQYAALDELDSYLDDPAGHTMTTLQPGEFAVIDNRVICHGRTAFRDDPTGATRLMLRTWIRR